MAGLLDATYLALHMDYPNRGTTLVPTHNKRKHLKATRVMRP